MIKITFHGAAQEVTGSMHLLEVDGNSIALDCGLFQGHREEARRKNTELPVEPARLHAVVLSHAHVDHCGRLPLLSKLGFAGPIYSTPATRDLAALLMSDSAHIQHEDVRYLNRKRLRNGLEPAMPLYEEADAVQCLRLFQTVPHGRAFELAPGLRTTFHQAGHMLGACFVVLHYASRAGHAPVRIVFSGDVGRAGLPILEDPEAFPPCDYLIVESTYGARTHPPAADLKNQLAEVITTTAARGGKVIIPAFSVGRTQTIVYYIHQLKLENRIPVIPVFVDSPLAVDATDVFRVHAELFDADAADFQRRTGDILGVECCTYLRDVEESKKLNTRHSPCVIISASGMCETGRIVHHLRNSIQSPKNTILIVGFQAAHTLGRRIVEKQPHVVIFGEKLRLRAQVVALNGFSGHADRHELREMTRSLAVTCRRAFLVHGELDQMTAMRETMLGDGFRAVEMPRPGDSFVLNGDGAGE